MAEILVNDKPLEILLAEDSKEVRELFELYISTTGANVVAAVDGLDALSKYVNRLNEGKLFDAVITDLSMPRADGATVTQIIKILNPKTQVIVVTGVEGNSQYRTLSDRLGQLKPDGVLQKPITQEDLTYAVSQIGDVIKKRKIALDYQPEPQFYVRQPQS